MTSKERIQTVLSHKDADRIALDLGATTVTGMHCIIVEKLRKYYGLEERPVRIVDAFQMLGEVDIEETDEEVYLVSDITFSEFSSFKGKKVDTDRLGKTKLTNYPFENADGSKFVISKDYFGNERNIEAPVA